MTDDTTEIEIEALTRGVFAKLTRGMLEALHHMRADQTVGYQLAQPLHGDGKATAVVFLPPTADELTVIRNVMTISVRGEGRAIVESMAAVIAEQTKEKDEATGAAIIAAFAALEQSIVARWKRVGDHFYIAS